MLAALRSGSLMLLFVYGCSAPPAKAPSKAEAAPAATSPGASGDALAALAAVPAPAPELRVAPAASAPAQPTQSPGYAETMARLRPAAAAEALKALEVAPTEPQRYAQAALAYASTDVPAMTLIWGMTYQALGGGKDDAAVAAALAKVLAERVVAQPEQNGKQVSYNLRLAPGQMPARQDADGSVHAPLAHVFEGLYGSTVMGFRPPWSVEQFYDGLSNWAGLVSTQGTPLDGVLELNAWLVAAAKDGHLEAYCQQLLGPAFAAEHKAYKAKSASALRAYKDYMKVSVFKPTRAVMPDDLVRVK